MGSLRRFFALLALLILAQSATAQVRSPDAPDMNPKALLRDIKVLSADDMEGRGIGTPGGVKARKYISQRFAEAGLASFNGGYLRVFDYRGKPTAANVVGYLKGSKHPDKYIVVTAHYDHLGIRHGHVYNGADDNASGTAALFALADYFRRNKPANSIIFAAFDGEEKGFFGSKRFVGHPPVPLASIALNINLDMISRNDQGALYAAGTHRHQVLKPYLDELVRTSEITLRLGHDGVRGGGTDWTKQSDQYSFFKKGIPFVYFGVEDHKDYHRPTDDFENINPEFYFQAVKVILNTISLMDRNLDSIKRK